MTLAEGGMGASFPERIDLGILNTCRLIHDEASNYLTTKNKLHLNISLRFSNEHWHDTAIGEQLGG